MTPYPKRMYHADKPSVTVCSAPQQAELGPGWSEERVRQKYPKYKYHWTKDPVIVHSGDEEAQLGGGWANTPAAFEPYQRPRPTQTDRQDPCQWIDEWSVPGMSGDHRQRIRAQLLKADAAFCRSPDPSAAAVDCMRLAFDGVARVLFESGILAAQLLRNEIPSLVWDSAIAGGWWCLASETQQEIFPEPVGHYWVWRDDSRDWPGLFRAEAAEWTARLLEAPEPAEKSAAAPDGTKLPAATSPTASQLASSGLGRKAARRNPRYKAIDDALRNVAQARPSSHEEVFAALEGRVRPPNAEPFQSEGGWLAGFRRNKACARAWLSKAWSRLELPAFPRGPKR